jgi:hypothetical protein
MARFAIVEQPKGHTGALRSHDPEHERSPAACKLRSQTTQAVNRLHNLLARVFPEPGHPDRRPCRRWPCGS